MVSDWRWIGGIFEVGLTDIQTYIQTDRPSIGKGIGKGKKK